MSEDAEEREVDEHQSAEAPIDCAVCGAPLEFEIGETTSDDAEWAETGTAARIGLLQRCTNVDCPTRGDSGMAKAVGPGGTQA